MRVNAVAPSLAMHAHLAKVTTEELLAELDDTRGVRPGRRAVGGRERHRVPRQRPRVVHDRRGRLGQLATPLTAAILTVSGEWSEWEWDESLFVGAAPYYARGRLPYAPALADAFARSLGLDGRGRLLDAGCGPGTVTLRLAHLFAAVVGLDPDVACSGRRSGSRRSKGSTTRAGCSCGPKTSPRASAPFASSSSRRRSTGWTGRASRRRCGRCSNPTGVVVHVDNRHQDRLAPGGRRDPPPPREAIAALRRAFLGDDRRAGQSVRNTSPGNEAEVFRAAGFTGPEVVVVPDGRTVVRSADDIVAETFSMSATAPHLFGARLSEFEAALRGVLTGRLARRNVRRAAPRQRAARSGGPRGRDCEYRAAPMPERIDADVCVVGAGYAGLTTAAASASGRQVGRRARSA